MTDIIEQQLDEERIQNNYVNNIKKDIGRITSHCHSGIYTLNLDNFKKVLTYFKSYRDWVDKEI